MIESDITPPSSFRWELLRGFALLAVIASALVLSAFLLASCSSVPPMPDTAVFEAWPLPSDSDIFEP